MASRSAPAILRFASLDSTNEEALRQLAAGSRTPLWIVAGEQTRGRGRGGRRWQSPRGNLYATHLFRTRATPSVATQLSFVAGLATYDAAAAHLPIDLRGALRLKWPNDLMLGGAKLAGILLESLASQAPEEGLFVVLGIGVNVSVVPHDSTRRIISLGLAPDDVDRVFSSLSASLETWLRRWDQGRGFAQIRQSWLDRAASLNKTITVNLNASPIRGKFLGVDATGALQLETEPGVVIALHAGDIYPEPSG